MLYILYIYYICYIYYIYIYIILYIYIMYRSKPSKNQRKSEMDGKICQDIKTPTPTHIPSSVRLSTWRRLED